MSYPRKFRRQTNNITKRTQQLTKTRKIESTKNQRWRCEMRFENKSRLVRRLLRLLLLLLLRVCCVLRQSCEGCQSTPPGRIVQCVWGVLCGVRVARSHAPEPRAPPITTFADRSRLQRRKTNSTQSSSVSSSRQSTRALSSMLQLHPSKWPHDFAGLRGVIALIWPHHIGRAVVRSPRGATETICHAAVLLAAVVCCAHVT